MTPDEEVFAALKASGLPGTKLAWQVGKAPPLPWFVYMRDKGGELFADDSNYERMVRFRAELYMKENDPATRAAFESAVSSVGPFSSVESWIPSESCYMVAYTFTHHPHK